MKRLVLIGLALCMLASPALARTPGGSQLTNKPTYMGLSITALESGYSCVGNACSYTQPCPATTGIDPECQHYRNLNLLTWRVTTTWQGWQPTLGGALNTTYVGYVDNIRRQAALLGACVIIDMHNFGGYPGMGKIGASNGPTRAQFVGVWELIAAQFAGKSGLCGYEPMNEPADMPTGAEWPADAQAVIYGIRTVDTTSTIYIDGDDYATAPNWLNTVTSPVACGYSAINPLIDGNNGLKNLIDPKDKLVFAGHMYPDYNGSGTFPVAGSMVNTSCTTQVPNTQCTVGQNSYQCAQSMGNQLLQIPFSANTSVDNIKNWVNWCEASFNPNGEHINCWMGETSWPNDDARWNTVGDNMLAFLQSQPIPILFTYWAGGPFAPSNYSIYPSGLGTSTVVDKNEVAVLEKYSNPYVPTTYGISGPSRGSVSVPSTAITTTYQGLLKTNVTVTPTDGGAGGTFSPTSATMTPGFNGQANFTYTAPSSTVVAIGATNNAGFSNPSSFGYATATDQFLNAGVIPYNIYSLSKIYAPYIGPLVNLRRASDNQTADFSATSLAMNSPLNVGAITTWANGSNVYIVKWYDQSPNGNNMVTPYTGDAPQATPTTAAQPQLILSDTDGKPSVNWNGSNAMQANSPINGNTAQTIMAVSAPSNHTGNSIVDWVFCCGNSNVLAWGGDIYSNSASYAARSYTVDGVWSATGASFGPTELDAVTNNVFIGKSIGTYSAMSYTYRSAVNVGWQPFAGNYYTGKVRELWISNTQTSPASMKAIQADQMSRYNIPAWTQFTYYSPTLQQNATTANAPPWAGVNQAGALGNFGFYNCSPGVGNTGKCPFNFATPAAGQTYYASRGMNMIRLPISWNALQPNLIGGDTTIDTGALATLDADVAAITNSGMDALIDLHGFGGYSGTVKYTMATADGTTTYWSGTISSSQLPMPTCTGPYDGNAPTLNWYIGGVLQQTIWNSPFYCNGASPITFWDYNNLYLNYPTTSVNATTGAFVLSFKVAPDAGTPVFITWTKSLDYTTSPGSTYFVNFWTQMAAHYASKPKVHFDLMNEPANHTAAAEKAVTQSAITGIRSQSFNNYVFVEFGSDYASCPNVSAESGPTFITLTDTSNKLILECHAYLASCNNDGCGDGAAQGAALSRLQSATTYCAANGCHLFWGEFNMTYNPQMYTEMKIAMDLIAANSSVWYGWTEFAGGPAWGENYIGLIEPRSFVAPVIDRPFMDLLNTYATGHTWPCTTYASGNAGPCLSTGWPNNTAFY